MPHSHGHFIECSGRKNELELQFQARQFNKRRLLFMVKARWWTQPDVFERPACAEQAHPRLPLSAGKRFLFWTNMRTFVFPVFKSPASVASNEHKADAQRTGIFPLLEAVSRSLFGKRRSFVQRPPLPCVGMKRASFDHFSYV